MQTDQVFSLCYFFFFFNNTQVPGKAGTSGPQLPISPLGPVVLAARTSSVVRNPGGPSSGSDVRGRSCLTDCSKDIHLLPAASLWVVPVTVLNWYRNQTIFKSYLWKSSKYLSRQGIMKENCPTTSEVYIWFCLKERDQPQGACFWFSLLNGFHSVLVLTAFLPSAMSDTIPRPRKLLGPILS